MGTFNCVQGEKSAIWRNEPETDWVERQRILVKLKDYSVAESTWERAIEFYQKWNSAIVKAREEAEIPQRLLKIATHPVSKTPFYQVK